MVTIFCVIVFHHIFSLVFVLFVLGPPDDAITETESLKQSSPKTDCTGSSSSQMCVHVNENEKKPLPITQSADQLAFVAVGSAS